jgi:hypothetical protein
MTSIVYVQNDNDKREATEEELNQRKIDALADKNYEAKIKAAQEQNDELKTAAISKLLEIGLSEAEINLLKI